VAVSAGLGGYGIATVVQTTQVLVVTRPVSIGRLITTADVRTAEVRLAAGVEAVTSSQADTVWGRPAAVPLRPGALLSPGQIGAAELPVAGHVLVAVAVAVPAGVGAGATVQVLISDAGALAAGGSGAAEGLQAAPVSATVVDVEPPGNDGDGTRVVTLQLPASTGPDVALAAATSDVALVLGDSAR
jgi:hypothetical protein